MGFKLELNSILRSKQTYDLKVGNTYSFEKSGSRLFFDDIPVWLTDENWNALAEISVLSQTRQHNQLTGTFRVDYLYQGDEQKTVTQMFIRMYDGVLDPYIYLLSSENEYQAAQASGVLSRDSLQSEGFIHASPKSQLNRVANKFYKKTQKPLLLTVDKSKVQPDIQWEPAIGGLYPHIYGPLNIDAVIKAKSITLNASGEFDLQNLRQPLV